MTPCVEAELDRRFPGRADRRAGDPDGLRTCWAALQRTWAAAVERADAMPAGTVDVEVDGEWSFAQTLPHLLETQHRPWPWSATSSPPSPPPSPPPS